MKGYSNNLWAEQARAKEVREECISHDSQPTISLCFQRLEFGSHSQQIAWTAGQRPGTIIGARLHDVQQNSQTSRLRFGSGHKSSNC